VPDVDDGLAVEQAVDLLSAEGAVALVAETDGRLVGAVLGAVSPVTAWIHRLSMLPEQPDEQEIAERLLDELEARFAQAGVRKLAAVSVAGAPLAAQLARRGYRGTTSATSSVTCGRRRRRRMRSPSSGAS